MSAVIVGDPASRLAAPTGPQVGTIVGIIVSGSSRVSRMCWSHEVTVRSTSPVIAALE
jgi:hypothetical protein